MLRRLILLPFLLVAAAASSSSFMRSHDGSEEWGYVQVRPKAHMFWWLYRSPYRVNHTSKPWPIILWLAGGPGTGGEAANFLSIGPLDVNLKPRHYTWLKKADILFVDNPVGAGYSFVEDSNLFVKTDAEAATDVTTLLVKLFSRDESLRQSPLFIVGESYAGKFAVTLGLSTLKAVEDGRLNLKLGGVALGDGWISPEDYALSWGPVLKDLSIIDDNGLEKSNSLAQKIKQQLQSGKPVDAYKSLAELRHLIANISGNASIYNFLLDTEDYSLSHPGDADIAYLFNGHIKKKLKIIPENVIWGAQNAGVVTNLQGDFVNPRIDEVDELLAKGVNVTVYNGQVDLIVAVRGTEAWLRKLKWEGLQSFLREGRTPLYCGAKKKIKGFVRSYQNLHFYWILLAGHNVPYDQPCVAFDMVGNITQSPRM